MCMAVNNDLRKFEVVVFKGLFKERKFKKSEITMEVGGWVQVSLGFFLF